MPPAILPSLTSQWGLPQREMFLGDRPPLLDDTSWAALNVLALVATVAALGLITGIAGAYLRSAPRSPRALLNQLGSPTGILVGFCGAVAIGMMAYGMGSPLFDRYFWPIVPPIAVLLMYTPPRFDDARTNAQVARPARRGAVAIASVLLVGLGALSLTYAANANAFDAALWRAGEALAAAGVPPGEIDAGNAWVGPHATTPPTGGGTGPVRYRQIWPEFRQCGSVTTDPQPQAGMVPVGAMSYQLFLIAGPSEPLYLFRGEAPGCRTK